MNTSGITVALLMCAVAVVACDENDAETVVEPGQPVTVEDVYIPAPPVAGHMGAIRSALDEIRRTFTIEDMDAQLWRERWPELWGNDGVDGYGHLAPPIRVDPATEARIIAMYGDDPLAAEASITRLRQINDPEFERYLEANRHVNPHFDRYLSEKGNKKR